MTTRAALAMLLLLPAVSVASAASPEPKAAKSKPADARTLKLVNFFLDTPTADLPPERVPDFIAVTPETLPDKLRMKFIARREELLALKRIADGKKKPPLRRLGDPELPPSSCAAPTEMSNPAVMGNFGFMEITEGEEQRLMDDTKCTECELRTEFSLTLVQQAKKKTGAHERSRVYYFLSTNDPLTALVGGYRQRSRVFGTNFFGIGHPSCR